MSLFDDMMKETVELQASAGRQLSESISQGLFDLTGGEIGQASPARLEKIQNAKIAGFQADFASALKSGKVSYIDAYSKLLGNLTSIGADTTEVEKALGTFSTQAERLSLQTERDKPEVSATGTPVDPERLAETAKYNQLIQEFGTEQGPIKFLEWQQEQKKILAEAGVTEAQEGLAPSVVTAINSAYNKSLKPLNDSIGQLDKGLSFVNQLEAGNPAAQTQLDKMLATLSGDTQLSEVEVKRVLRVGNLPTRIVDTVSRFFLGMEVAETVEEKKTLISAMREVIVERQKLEQSRLKETWKHAQGVTDEILNDMFSIPDDKSSGYTQEDIDAELRIRGLL